MGPTQRIGESQRLPISYEYPLQLVHWQNEQTLNQWENSYILASQILMRFTQHHTEIGTEQVQCTQLPAYERMER